MLKFKLFILLLVGARAFEMDPDMAGYCMSLPTLSEKAACIREQNGPYTCIGCPLDSFTVDFNSVVFNIALFQNRTSPEVPITSRADCAEAFKQLGYADGDFDTSASYMVGCYHAMKLGDTGDYSPVRVFQSPGATAGALHLQDITYIEMVVSYPDVLLPHASYTNTSYYDVVNTPKTTEECHSALVSLGYSDVGVVYHDPPSGCYSYVVDGNPVTYFSFYEDGFDDGSTLSSKLLYATTTPASASSIDYSELTVMSAKFETLGVNTNSSGSIYHSYAGIPIAVAGNSMVTAAFTSEFSAEVSVSVPGSAGVRAELKTTLPLSIHETVGAVGSKLVFTEGTYDTISHELTVARNASLARAEVSQGAFASVALDTNITTEGGAVLIRGVRDCPVPMLRRGDRCPDISSDHSVYRWGSYTISQESPVSCDGPFETIISEGECADIGNSLILEYKNTGKSAAEVFALNAIANDSIVDIITPSCFLKLDDNGNLVSVHGVGTMSGLNVCRSKEVCVSCYHDADGCGDIISACTQDELDRCPASCGIFAESHADAAALGFFYPVSSDLVASGLITASTSSWFAEYSPGVSVRQQATFVFDKPGIINVDCTASSTVTNLDDATDKVEFSNGRYIYNAATNKYTHHLGGTYILNNTGIWLDGGIVVSLRPHVAVGSLDVLINQSTQWVGCCGYTYTCILTDMTINPNLIQTTSASSFDLCLDSARENTHAYAAYNGIGPHSCQTSNHVLSVESSLFGTAVAGIIKNETSGYNSVPPAVINITCVSDAQFEFDPVIGTYNYNVNHMIHDRIVDGTVYMLNLSGVYNINNLGESLLWYPENTIASWDELIDKTTVWKNHEVTYPTSGNCTLSGHLSYVGGLTVTTGKRIVVLETHAICAAPRTKEECYDALDVSSTLAEWTVRSESQRLLFPNAPIGCYTAFADTIRFNEVEIAWWVEASGDAPDLSDYGCSESSCLTDINPGCRDVEALKIWHEPVDSAWGSMDGAISFFAISERSMGLFIENSPMLTIFTLGLEPASRSIPSNHIVTMSSGPGNTFVSANHTIATVFKYDFICADDPSFHIEEYSVTLGKLLDSGRVCSDVPTLIQTADICEFENKIQTQMTRDAVVGIRLNCPVSCGTCDEIPRTPEHLVIMDVVELSDPEGGSNFVSVQSSVAGCVQLGAACSESADCCETDETYAVYKDDVPATVDSILFGNSDTPPPLVELSTTRVKFMGESVEYTGGLDENIVVNETDVEIIGDKTPNVTPEPMGVKALGYNRPGGFKRFSELLSNCDLDACADCRQSTITNETGHMLSPDSRNPIVAGQTRGNNSYLATFFRPGFLNSKDDIERRGSHWGVSQEDIECDVSQRQQNFNGLGNNSGVRCQNGGVGFDPAMPAYYNRWYKDQARFPGTPLWPSGAKSEFGICCAYLYATYGTNGYREMSSGTKYDRGTTTSAELKGENARGMNAYGASKGFWLSTPEVPASYKDKLSMCYKDGLPIAAAPRKTSDVITGGPTSPPVVGVSGDMCRVGDPNQQNVVGFDSTTILDRPWLNWVFNDTNTSLDIRVTHPGTADCSSTTTPKGEMCTRKSILRRIVRTPHSNMGLDNSIQGGAGYRSTHPADFDRSSPRGRYKKGHAACAEIRQSRSQIYNYRNIVARIDHTTAPPIYRSFVPVVQGAPSDWKLSSTNTNKIKNATALMCPPLTEDEDGQCKLTYPFNSWSDGIEICRRETIEHIVYSSLTINPAENYAQQSCTAQECVPTRWFQNMVRNVGKKKACAAFNCTFYEQQPKFNCQSVPYKGYLDDYYGQYADNLHHAYVPPNTKEECTPGSVQLVTYEQNCSGAEPVGMIPLPIANFRDLVLSDPTEASGLVMPICKTMGPLRQPVVEVEPELNPPFDDGHNDKFYRPRLFQQIDNHQEYINRGLARSRCNQMNESEYERVGATTTCDYTAYPFMEDANEVIDWRHTDDYTRYFSNRAFIGPLFRQDTPHDHAPATVPSGQLSTNAPNLAFTSTSFSPFPSWISVGVILSVEDGTSVMQGTVAALEVINARAAFTVTQVLGTAYLTVTIPADIWDGLKVGQAVFLMDNIVSGMSDERTSPLRIEAVIDVDDSKQAVFMGPKFTLEGMATLHWYTQKLVTFTNKFAGFSNADASTTWRSKAINLKNDGTYRSTDDDGNDYVQKIGCVEVSDRFGKGRVDNTVNLKDPAD